MPVNGRRRTSSWQSIEMENRHQLNFDIYEEGKLTLEEYLGRVVFYQKRPFTRAQCSSVLQCPRNLNLTPK